MLKIPLKPLKQRSTAGATIRRTSTHRDWLIVLVGGRRYKMPKTYTFTPEAAAGYARMLFGEAAQEKGG